jgi:hypothetical protein
MPALDLTDEEHAALTVAARKALANNPFPRAPRLKRLQPAPGEALGYRRTPDQLLALRRSPQRLATSRNVGQARLTTSARYKFSIPFPSVMH